MRVSEISLGTWAFGSEWGEVSDDESYATLNRAIDLGVNFLDTADVYGDGRSEKLIGRLLRERPDDEIFVATKAGRRLDPHTAEGYDYEHLSAFVERSLDNLGVEALDLLQLHCPPTGVYRRDETFEASGPAPGGGQGEELWRQRREGRGSADGPVLSRREDRPGHLQHLPPEAPEEFFPLAEERNIGVLARVPLASGLLSGKMSADRIFSENDHRNFNREGQLFDRGETFSGVNFETASGRRGAKKPRPRRLHPGAAGAALDPDAPGCLLRHPRREAARPARGQPRRRRDARLSEETMQRIRGIYDRSVRPEVHHLW